MTVYLDASILVALISEDALAEQADALLRSTPDPTIVSDFAVAEMVSALSRKIRSGDLSRDEARSALAMFDAEVASAAVLVDIAPSDVQAATAFLRRFDLSLRAPDAIHIATASRFGAALATFDRRLAADAGRLGLATRGLSLS